MSSSPGRRHRCTREEFQARIQYALQLLLSGLTPTTAYLRLCECYNVCWRQACRYGVAAQEIVREVVWERERKLLSELRRVHWNPVESHYIAIEHDEVQHALLYNDRVALLQIYREILSHDPVVDRRETDPDEGRPRFL